MTRSSDSQSRRRDTRSRQCVEIVVTPEAAYVPKWAHQIKPLLECTVKEPRYLSKQHRLGWHPRRLCFWTLSKKHIVVSAGVVPRLIKFLEGTGVNVVLDDRRPLVVTPIPCAICTATEACSPAHALRRWQSALVCGVSEHNLAPIVAQAVEALSPQSVLILVPRTQQLRVWSAHLTHPTWGPPSLLTSKQPSSGWRVKLATLETAVLTDLSVADVVLFPYAEDALAWRAVEVWKPIQYRRFFGFASNATQFDAQETLRLECVFGERITLSKQAINRYVATVPLVTHIGHCERKDKTGAATLEMKRSAIWNNASRNAVIADLVRSLAGESVKPCGVVPPTTLAFFNGLRRLAVLVENLEHAEQLAAHLRVWQVLDRPDVLQLQAATPSDGSRMPCWGGNVILTYAALDTLRHRLAEIIVRADAGIGVLVAAAKAAPEVIVDLADAGTHMLADRAKERVAAYKKDGWTMLPSNESQLQLNAEQLAPSF
jgi:hypothetical protein